MTQLQRPYLLIADDDPDDQEMFAEPFLEQNPGANIVFVNDGQAALEYLGKHEGDWPCVMLLDYKMPKLNGCDVLAKIKKEDRYKSMHKVVWSTSDNPDYVSNCLRHGADKYFKKPNSIEELNDLVRYLSKVYQSAQASVQ
ncbi:MAG: response regulator [Bacteroidota bacterium]|nr:response regulator [Bacteroidota bacterium]MDP4216844.1 response regulator [Bacteroidota bacterium]MDP4244829.1 response regulator [Bacteroidota bacterium]MDP4255068.1 response regulator [Bacteroidota bacterium]MDP4260526.1 response regulator [Bacteroidota bacterium]